jgi:hypothetical protein
MKETVCHCNVKENAQLIADILDVDVRGEVYDVKGKAFWEVWEKYPVIYGKDTLFVCSLCSAKFLEHSRYCPNCGAFMDEIVKKYKADVSEDTE